MKKTNYNFIVMMIIDSFGIGGNYEGNAIAGNMPFVNNAISDYPSAAIKSSIPISYLTEDSYRQLASGLSISSITNRLNSDFEFKEVTKAKTFKALIKNTEENKTNFHLIGLISNSSIESNKNHLWQMADFFKKKKQSVFVHLILDGENDPNDKGVLLLEEFQEHLKGNEYVKIASLAGRYYAMDKGFNWGRSMKYFRALVNGEANTTTDILKSLQENYQKNIYDNEIRPIVVTKRDKPLVLIQKGDSVLFVNTRPLGLRQIARLLSVPGNERLDGWQYVRNLKLASMSYLGDFYPVEYIGKKFEADTIGSTLADKEKNMLYISDVQKAAYFNFFKPKSKDDELSEYVIDDFDNVGQFKKTITKAIRDHSHNLIIISNSWLDRASKNENISEASTFATELDGMVKKIARDVMKKKGLLILTSTYGRAEKLIDMNTGDRIYRKSDNNIPFIVIGDGLEGKNLNFPEVIAGDLNLVEPIGTLSDIAPTVLGLFGIDKSKKMTGNNLLDV